MRRRFCQLPERQKLWPQGTPTRSSDYNIDSKRTADLMSVIVRKGRHNHQDWLIALCIQ